MSLPATFVRALSVIAILTGSFSAYADPVTFFNTIPSGRDYFDNQVSDAGGTLYTDALSGLTSGVNTWTQKDFTITSTNGANRTVTTSRLNPAPTGLPGGDAINMTADGSTASGLTFTFSSPINGFGIELDDWATCCYPSSLYISFDGGTPILIGTATQSSDNPGTAAGQGAKTFIGTIDDSGTFTVITFYGTGNGDVLNAGGIIRYAIVPLGAISGGGTGYTNTVSNTPVSTYAEYFNQFDDNGGARQTVADYLNNQTSQEKVAEDLKTIFPVNTSVTAQSMISSSGQTSNTLIEKVGTVLGGLSPSSGMGFTDNAPVLGFSEDASMSAMDLPDNDPIAALASMPYQKFQAGQNAVWLEGVGAGADGKKTSATMGYDTASHGVVGGYEFAIDPDHMIGILASTFRSITDVDNNAGKSDATNYNVGIYGQKLMGALKLTAIGTVGYGDFEGERRISIGGVNANPQSDYNAYSASASVGASRLYEQDDFQIEPFGMLSYTAVKTDGYTEENGGAFNMDVSGDRFSTAAAKVGVTVQHTTKVNDRDLTFKVKPYVAQQWEIESAGNTTNFVGAGSATTVNGRDLTVFESGVGAEAKYDFSDSTSLKFGTDLSRDKYEQRYIAYVGVGVKF